MTTSLRLLLTDYLSLMREEGELDVFLPLLMASMEQEVVFRPQKGTRQYGVDVSSIGVDTDGVQKMFIWLIKCGDIGRADWDSGPQSIRQSMNDIADVYLRSHLLPQHKKLPKKVLIVTNGDFQASLNETIAGFVETWSERSGASAELVNGLMLARWTEEKLLNEYVMPVEERGLFRRMLANVSTPELCINAGGQLIDQLLRGASGPYKSKGAKEKAYRTALRGIATSLLVLQVWSQSEGNLRASYRLSEYAVLAVWAKFHREIASEDQIVLPETVRILRQLSHVAEAYHHKLDGHYRVQNSFAYLFPDSALSSRAVFEEIGRLGLQGYLWARSAVVDNNEVAHLQAERFADRLECLLDTHSCSDLPQFDHHSSHIHIALILLLSVNRGDAARQWIVRMCERLEFAFLTKKYLPTRATFDDVLQIRFGYMDEEDEHLSATTLIPILLVWVAALDVDGAYEFLRTELGQIRSKTTPTFWSAEAGYDDVVADGDKLHHHGIGVTIPVPSESPKEFVEQMSKPFPNCIEIESSSWFKAGASLIPLLAALYWNTQIPREFLVRQALELSGAETQGIVPQEDAVSES